MKWLLFIPWIDGDGTSLYAEVLTYGSCLTNEFAEAKDSEREIWIYRVWRCRLRSVEGIEGSGSPGSLFL